MIIGAVDNSIASKQLLIEQLPGLAEQGLKRVYIENLPRDLFHRKLKVLNNQLNGNNNFGDPRNLMFSVKWTPKF